MDQARRGEEALKAGDYATAAREYTAAIHQNPRAVSYYQKRSTAYRRSSPPDYANALKDAEVAVKLAIQRQNRTLIGDTQLDRAIVLFQLERYGDAAFVFAIVRRKNDKLKTLDIWEAKTKNKLKALPEGDKKAEVTMTEEPDVRVPTEADLNPDAGAQESTKSAGDSPLPATNAATTVAPLLNSKIRNEWYQNPSHVFITIFAKGVSPDSVTHQFEEKSTEVSFPVSDGSTYDFTLDPLYGPINPSNSTCTVFSTKIELKLEKKRTLTWKALESDDLSPKESTEENDSKLKTSLTAQEKENTATKTIQQAKAPAYPTSSRSGPKNWDKIADDLTAVRKDKDDGPTEENTWTEADEDELDGPDSFFKKLYAGASDDAKRAMMKSYVESNGTALSTDWSDVSKRKVETAPPDGMEARKWNE
ncbi:SGT1 and CS domain-containing protein [Rhizodiscina lignyota]|uniref:SGT1 and CS domain-containing protein n=1 Tax=Rhizodiscina lignyota TaxID=1504668 RepID=A0A9P4ICE6_9PEZI|nr:SGT1 and CS domain-containing protein [Rhizodiscina lignyota]